MVSLEAVELVGCLGAAGADADRIGGVFGGGTGGVFGPGTWPGGG